MSYPTPTFRPSGALKQCKNTVFAIFLFVSASLSCVFLLSLLCSSFFFLYFLRPCSFFLSLLWLFPPLLLHLSKSRKFDFKFSFDLGPLPLKSLDLFERGLSWGIPAGLAKLTFDFGDCRGLARCEHLRRAVTNLRLLMVCVYVWQVCCHGVKRRWGDPSRPNA